MLTANATERALVSLFYSRLEFLPFTESKRLEVLLHVSYYRFKFVNAFWMFWQLSSISPVVHSNHSLNRYKVRKEGWLLCYNDFLDHPWPIVLIFRLLDLNSLVRRSSLNFLWRHVDWCTVIALYFANDRLSYGSDLSSIYFFNLKLSIGWTTQNHCLN